jgi:Holliday junction resolvase RusA-like endonuclease
MTLSRDLQRLGIDPSRVLAVDGKPYDAAVVDKPSDIRRNYDGLIFIRLHGAPIGKPRMTRRDKWAKRPAVLRYREWADRLREVAGTLPSATEVDALNWTAYFEPPVSWSKKRRLAAMGTLHRAKPDLDNVAKAVMDALWTADSGIAQGTIAKRWDWTARIEIEILTAARPQE